MSYYKRDLSDQVSIMGCSNFTCKEEGWNLEAVY